MASFAWHCIAFLLLLLLPTSDSQQIYHDCGHDNGQNLHGIYTITPKDSQNSFDVVCEDGWVVFQRRFDGSVDFYRNFVDYKNGFGSLDGEFWLGLQKIHELTSDGRKWELLVELKNFDWSLPGDGKRDYALYDHFKVKGPFCYGLDVGYFVEGDLGDSLRQDQLYCLDDWVPPKRNSTCFTAKDNCTAGDNACCAFSMHSGWWHDDELHEKINIDSKCNRANVNGIYGRYYIPEVPLDNYMIWFSWIINNNINPCEKTELKIRPASVPTRRTCKYVYTCTYDDDDEWVN